MRPVSREAAGHVPRHALKSLTTMAPRGIINVDENFHLDVQQLDFSKSFRTNFDSSAVTERLNRMWMLNAEFGVESNPFEVYLVIYFILITIHFKRIKISFHIFIG